MKDSSFSFIKLIKGRVKTQNNYMGYVLSIIESWRWTLYPM